MNYLSSNLKKFSSASVLVCAIQAVFILAPGVANASVTCDAGSAYTKCYDFTVYNNRQDPSGTPSSGSLGFFEGFIGYSGSGTALTDFSLQKAYFIASGTTTGTASLLSDATFQGPGFASRTNTAPLLNTVNGSLTGALNTVGTNNGPIITFSTTSGGTPTYYALLLGTRNAVLKSSSISIEAAANTAGNILSSTGAYTTTFASTDALGTRAAFGYQIAPEMSPLMGFNVLALLACLFLLFRNKKYFAYAKPRNEYGLTA